MLEEKRMQTMQDYKKEAASRLDVLEGNDLKITNGDARDRVLALYTQMLQTIDKCHKWKIPIHERHNVIFDAAATFRVAARKILSHEEVDQLFGTDADLVALYHMSPFS